MNVRLTPTSHPTRTLLYGGIQTLAMNDHWLLLRCLDGKDIQLERRDYGRIDIDNDPGDWW